ncbi:type II toxin-antitoxin system Phd/YefM family antitoxin [Sinorhizobium arboris]|uniref:type II toxin-antitoxin system Phd/YefM family antitoxin n=1 Tax=Sinorhizobium arboris TaxID=76745 RepID=UPI000A064699|nr:type II toxin-antitoxin system Phd/YefM family antitoxin [Sinorhizobium arboris]
MELFRQDAALREPVIIAKNGRPRTVLLAYKDYLRLARRDRRVEATADLRLGEQKVGSFTEHTRMYARQVCTR